MYLQIMTYPENYFLNFGQFLGFFFILGVCGGLMPAMQ